MIKALYWRARIFFLALRWVRQTNLGDQVWYEGKKYYIHNGCRDKSWRLYKLKNGNDGWVLRSECKKVKSFRNYYHSFQYGWSFYMTNWYSIWMREGIKPWMRGCNIWPRRNEKG